MIHAACLLQNIPISSPDQPLRFAWRKRKPCNIYQNRWGSEYYYDSKRDSKKLEWETQSKLLVNLEEFLSSHGYSTLSECGTVEIIKRGTGRMSLLGAHAISCIDFSLAKGKTGDGSITFDAILHGRADWPSLLRRPLAVQGASGLSIFLSDTEQHYPSAPTVPWELYFLGKAKICPGFNNVRHVLGNEELRAAVVDKYI